MDSNNGSLQFNRVKIIQSVANLDGRLLDSQPADGGERIKSVANPDGRLLDSQPQDGGERIKRVASNPDGRL